MKAINIYTGVVWEILKVNKKTFQGRCVSSPEKVSDWDIGDHCTNLNKEFHRAFISWENYELYEIRVEALNKLFK